MSDWNEAKKTQAAASPISLQQLSSACLKGVTAERDRLQSQLQALQQSVQGEIERWRREAESDRKSSESRGGDERNLWAAVAFESSADRLAAILGREQ